MGSGVSQAAQTGAGWIVGATIGGKITPLSPVGFYFARLWYYGELHPLIFATDALRRMAERSKYRSVLPAHRPSRELRYSRFG